MKGHRLKTLVEEKKMTKSPMKSTMRNYLPALLVLLILAGIGSITVKDYGISWDEIFSFRAVTENYEVITQNKPDTGTLTQLYGIVFDVFAEGVYQVQKRFSSRSEAGLWPRFYSKHAVTFLFSLIAYVAVIGIVGIFCGPRHAWLGAVILALMPVWWGHSFFNPKDIPFGALMILGVYGGAYLIYEFFKNTEVEPADHGRNNALSILVGCFVGVLNGVRIGGFLFLGFILATHVLLLITERKSFRTWVSFVSSYFLMFLSWFMVTTFIHPSGWSNPIRHLLKMIGMMSNFTDWRLTVLFQGQFLPAGQLPWYYLPQWLIMSVPVIFQVFFLIGLAVLLLSYSRFSLLQKAAAILLILEIFLLPGVAVIRHSTLYDGMRHFLFVLPGMAVLAAVGMITFCEKLNPAVKKVSVSLLFISFLPIVFDMVQLHPYEYVYFNRAFGGLKGGFNRYETDYWGLSLRNAMNWLNQQKEDPVKVFMGSGDAQVATITAGPKIRIIGGVAYPESRKNLSSEKPFYYLSLTRWDGHKEFSECPVVYEVSRQTVPLAVIKRCAS